MQISQQAQTIGSSPTLALNDKARALVAQGKPVIHLGIGEPPNDAPAGAIRYVTSRLETRQIKYAPTAGTSALREAIQAYTAEHYGRRPDLKNIIVTVGAKQSLVNVFFSLVNPGEEVILLAPYWVSYPEMIKLAGGNMKIAQSETLGNIARYAIIIACALIALKEYPSCNQLLPVILSEMEVQKLQ